MTEKLKKGTPRQVYQRIRKLDETKGRFKAPWDQIRKLCAMQCTREEIASFVGCGSDTLNDCSKKDFECTFTVLMNKWREGGLCSLRRKQWMLADKNAAMAIFLGKQYLGQTDNYRHQGESVPNMQIVHYSDKAPKPWKDNSGKVIEVKGERTTEPVSK